MGRKVGRAYLDDRSVIGIAARGMIGGIQNLADLGDFIANGALDAVLERHAHHATALAATAELEKHGIVADVEKCHHAAVRCHRGIDDGVEHLLHPATNFLRRQHGLGHGFGDERFAGGERVANRHADERHFHFPVGVAGERHARYIMVDEHLAHALDVEQPVHQGRALRLRPVGEMRGAVGKQRRARLEGALLGMHHRRRRADAQRLSARQLEIETQLIHGGNNRRNSN